MDWSRVVGLSLVGLVLAAAGLIWAQQRGDWDQSDPGLVVVLSDTEVAMTHSWFCNPQRVRVVESNDDEIELVFESLNQNWKKFCGIGDCGVSVGPDTVAPDRVDPTSCQHPFTIDEAIGDRDVRVKCRSLWSCQAPVQDARSAGD